MTTLAYRVNGQDLPIGIGSDAWNMGAAQMGAVPRLLITDTTVAALWGESAAAHFNPAAILTVPPGEAHKTLESVQQLAAELAHHALPRDGMLLALGGGVVTDLTGFLAATWLRGVRWIALPTTLTGMVDAAIGGKTGVNTPAGKNLLGAFHQPAGIWINPGCLTTLPARERHSGLGEVLKTACLEADCWRWLCEIWCEGSTEGPANLIETISRCAAIKAWIVEQDPLETLGPRRRLNLGHTLGHAVEAAQGGSVPHGCCVALGLAYVTLLGEAAGLTDPAYGAAIRARALPLWPSDIPLPAWEALLPYLQQDKKRTAEGTLRWQVPQHPGAIVEHSMPVAAPQSAEAWDSLRSLFG